ncbi:MAG: aromatic ring-hydroxylating dioxygenase subunit alpha [Pseudonocardia sp.]|nr:MAG: aromatic ring-hydroxylating dioxygenase subunit alpha [Pseudonocardia sp.]
MTFADGELERLVDWERGIISPRVYSDQEIFNQEMEQIFGRTWLFLAHDSMIPNPGDFFSTYMGTDPVLVVRQRDKSVKAFLNVCRHRGMAVCRADMGNLKAFTCTYHGWTYGTGGELVSVPMESEGGYNNEIDKSQWGLAPVAQVQSYQGLIFGNFDLSAPPLLEYLGPMKWYLDSVFDRREGGIEFAEGVHKWVVPGNWKMPTEQFAGDSYHAGSTHNSAMIGAMSEAPVSLVETIKGDGRQYSDRGGHGLSFNMNTLKVAPALKWGDQVLTDYYDKYYPEIEDRIGTARAEGPAMNHFTMFPNFSGLGSGGNLRVWHPKGPNEMEIWLFTYFDADAPDEVKEANRRSNLHTEGPAGTFDQDDGENWALIGDNLAGATQASKLFFNFQMGLGRETEEDPDYPGRVLPVLLGDSPQRGFYRRWLEFMTSENYPHLPPTSTAGDPRFDGGTI